MFSYISNFFNFNLINNVYTIFYSFATISIYDLLLVLIFGAKARWFQLHAFINLIIVFIVSYDSYQILKSPINNYIEYNTWIEKYDVIYVFCLHLYHMLMFSNVKRDEYIHHIIFVLCGVCPSYFFINSNALKLGFFAGCGLPGVIEYITLALVKNNRLKSIDQKKLMTYVYCYLRSPLSLTACIINYILYTQNKINDNIYFFVYINMLIFINSTYYTKATIENYYKTLIKLIQH